MFIFYLFIVCNFFFLFFFLMKINSLNIEMMSTFECGFTSYFFSRFSFSIHYFYISVIFLFLDLELAMAMPFFNSPPQKFSIYLGMSFFFLALLLGFLEEWASNKLEWSF